MNRRYIHVMDEEISSIGGRYLLEKEEKIEFNGRDLLYAIGVGIIDSSCCGSGGCRYAVIPGYVVSWKSGVNKEGKSTSIVEPIKHEETRKRIIAIIKKKEHLTQVQFW